MNSIEQKRTIAKLVLVVSTILLIVLLLVQFYPKIFSSSSVIGDSTSTTDLKTAYEQIQEKYKTSTEQIKVYKENAENLNTSTNELKSYTDKKIPKYAIGGGISLILGLWISTVILYIKERRTLFKK